MTYAGFHANPVSGAALKNRIPVFGKPFEAGMHTDGALWLDTAHGNWPGWDIWIDTCKYNTRKITNRRTELG